MEVTIVTEYAERLVREGGVVNRDPSNPPPGDPNPEISLPPFTAFLLAPCLLHEHCEAARLKGTVTVVDVHHADDEEVCFRWGEPEDWGNGYGTPVLRPCHPDADPGRWHWVVVADDERRMT